MTPRPSGARPGREVAELRGPFDPGGQPIVRTNRHLHLSLFAWNVQSGLSASKAVNSDPAKHRDVWRWENAEPLLRELDASGMDSHLQYGMWSGYGGETGWNEYQLDWASAGVASAAVTKRVGLIQTVHVGYGLHPVFIAKQTASLDHISGGRGGLNIVAGQGPLDYAQFGIDGPPSAEVRYDIADEVTTALKHLWTADEPIDFEGEYFQMYGAQIKPRATSRPRPLLVSAAGSGVGLDYATRQCDVLFITSLDNTLDGFTARAQKIHDMAAAHDRRVRVAAMCYVVMDETDAAAQETVAWMREEIDREAIRNWLFRSGHVLNSQGTAVDGGSVGKDRDASLDEDPYLGVGQYEYEALGLGMGAYQLFGSYETVAQQLIDLYEAGVEQFALCFFEPRKGVQQMRDHVLPILRARGYNEDAISL